MINGGCQVPPCGASVLAMVYSPHMSKLLEQAIEQLRELPEEEQDAVADVVFAYIASDEREYALTREHLDEVSAIQKRLRSGETRLATAGEVSSARRKVHL
jgi:hypothetical protein